MSDRGIKKWAPYRSLPEQAPSLEKVYDDNKVMEKPIMSDEVKEEINEILQNYHGQELLIKYYRGQRIYSLTSLIKKIDVQNQRLLLEGKNVLFSELISISEI